MTQRTLFSRFETARASYVYDTCSNAILAIPRELWDQLGNAGCAASRDVAANDGVAALKAAGYLQPCEVTRMQFYPAWIWNRP